MLVTIEEAKNKLCVMPFQSGRTICRADECMAWRWETTFVGNTPKIDAIKKYRQETGAMLKDAKDYVEAHPHLYDCSSERKGYCGLVEQS